MSYNWEIKEGDSLPELEAQIRDPSGAVADLSSVQSVEFRLAHPRSDTLITSTDATITDAGTGRVQHDISTSETGLDGLHYVEWRVTRSSGETYSYPNDENQELFIHPGVGRDLDTAATTNGTYSVGSLTADSIDTEQVFSESRGPRVVVHVNDTAIVADGPNGELASGDIGTAADVTSVLQTALDEGGHVLVRGHSSDYTLESVGTDGEGSKYCLSMPSDTDLELEQGAVLKYPASGASDSDGNSPDVATPILGENVSNIRIRGRGTIDGGVHVSSQDNSNGASYNAMGLKFGCRDTADTACSNIEVSGITVTGAWRHGIEASGPKDAGSERGHIADVTFDDASGDDDVSISVGAKYWTVRDCWSINKSREGFWTAASFEAEDGAEHVVFDSLYSIGSAHHGITIGKSHGPDNPCRNHTAVNCTVINPAKDAYRTGGTEDGTAQVQESIRFENCEAINPGLRGFYLYGGSSNFTQKDIHVDIRATGCGHNAFNAVPQGTVDGLTIPETAVFENAGAETHCVRFASAASSTLFKNISIAGLYATGDNDILRFEGDNTNYGGLNRIENCELELINSWEEIRFPTNTNAREHFHTIGNTGGNKTSVRPTETFDGMRIYAGASLRSTAYAGYDYYDDANSQWREM